jgi:hypothetical protein
MDKSLKERFLEAWGKYFGKVDLPITFFYTDREGCADLVKAPAGHRCLIADLAKARKGISLSFDVSSIGCFGGKRYVGFADALMPNFEYFLSCGIPGQLEGERYKKSPEIVREVMKINPRFQAPGRFIVFKRWDKIGEDDMPEAAIFFAPPDVLSGLFTLANFDEIEPNGVIAPFCAGCGSIVQYPYVEQTSERPRAVLGMFDVSARPFVPENLLTFSTPMKKLVTMIENMDQSFLTTGSWAKVRRRTTAVTNKR